MLTVTVELNSAITGKTTVIEKMTIGNIGRAYGESHNRCNYIARVKEVGEHHQPWMPLEWITHPTTGYVFNYDRRNNHVWNLVALALQANGYGLEDDFENCSLVEGQSYEKRESSGGPDAEGGRGLRGLRMPGHNGDKGDIRLATPPAKPAPVPYLRMEPGAAFPRNSYDPSRVQDRPSSSVRSGSHTTSSAGYIGEAPRSIPPSADELDRAAERDRSVSEQPKGPEGWKAGAAQVAAEKLAASLDPRYRGAVRALRLFETEAEAFRSLIQLAGGEITLRDTEGAGEVRERGADND